MLEALWFMYYIWLFGVGVALIICSFLEDWGENYRVFIKVALGWPVLLVAAFATWFAGSNPNEDNI